MIRNFLLLLSVSLWDMQVLIRKKTRVRAKILKLTKIIEEKDAIIKAQRRGFFVLNFNINLRLKMRVARVNLKIQNEKLTQIETIIKDLKAFESSKIRTLPLPQECLENVKRFVVGKSNRPKL